MLQYFACIILLLLLWEPSWPSSSPSSADQEKADWNHQPTGEQEDPLWACGHLQLWWGEAVNEGPGGEPRGNAASDLQPGHLLWGKSQTRASPVRETLKAASPVASLMLSNLLSNLFTYWATLTAELTAETVVVRQCEYYIFICLYYLYIYIFIYSLKGLLDCSWL